MLTVALRILFGDVARYIGMILGITFASLVMTQQGSIFTGLMSRTFGFVTDTSLQDLWVMDPMVRYVDDSKPMSDTKLSIVRGVPGVGWAVPMYKGNLRARLENGAFQQCNVIGLDDATLIGGPPMMVEGRIEDLKRSDAVIVDQVGAEKRLATRGKTPSDPSTPLKIGAVLELNDKRAQVVGIAKVSRTFQSQPVIYTTYSRATSFAPRERKLLSFILVKAKQGIDPASLATTITQKTGLAAFTNAAFKELTVRYYLNNTGIPINFGISVLLGLIVGSAIAGQTFFNFTLDNLRYFGTFKAMGAGNGIIFLMVALQGLVVALIGYGLGVGIASLFYYLSKNSELAFLMPWQLLAGVGVAVLVITTGASILGCWTVWRTDPAIVFKS
jgi:putative ABC transport system permease protein